MSSDEKEISDVEGGGGCLVRRVHRPLVGVGESVGECDYCGAALSGVVFFCRVCGKPYREPPGSRAIPPPMGREELIRARAPDFWPVFWGFCLAVFAGALASWMLFGTEASSRAYALVVNSLVILLVTGYYSVRHMDVLMDSVLRSGFDRAEAYWAFGVLVGLLGLNWFWHGPFLGLWGERVDPGFREIGLSLPGMLMLFCVLPSISEELAFRGLLQPMLTRALGSARSVWMVGVLFAAVHLSVYSFPYLLLVGLYLGRLRERTGSLYPGMVIHALHNALVVVFVWNL